MRDFEKGPAKTEKVCLQGRFLHKAYLANSLSVAFPARGAGHQGDAEIGQ